MSKRLPVLLSVAALVVTMTALPSSAANRGDPACTADTPVVKTLKTAVEGVIAAGPTKLQTALGDLFKAVLAAQEAKCLPALPTSPVTPPAPPPPPGEPAPPVDACLAAVVNLLGAVLGGVSATLAVPPDPAAVTAAIAKLAEAVKALNVGKCLPIQLPVPGLPAPPLPAR